MGGCQRDTEANWKGFQWSNLEQFVQENKAVLDYNLMYKKLNIHESILI